MRGGCNDGRGAGESGINNRVVVLAALTVMEDFECPCDLHRAAAITWMYIDVPGIYVDSDSLSLYGFSCHFLCTLIFSWKC